MEKFIKSIEILSENVPTIFKIIGNWVEASELANDAIALCSILKRIGENSLLNKLEIKVNLIKASLIYHEALLDQNRFKDLQRQLKIIDENFNDSFLDYGTV